MFIYSCRAILVLARVLATLELFPLDARVAVITCIAITDMFSFLGQLVFKSSLCFVSKFGYTMSSIEEEIFRHGARMKG